MKQIGIIGASGYTGFELIKLVKKHPKLELKVLNSKSYEGKKVNSLYSDYDGDETFTNFGPVPFSISPHRDEHRPSHCNKNTQPLQRHQHFTQERHRQDSHEDGESISHRYNPGYFLKTHRA